MRCGLRGGRGEAGAPPLKGGAHNLHPCLIVHRGHLRRSTRHPNPGARTILSTAGLIRSASDPPRVNPRHGARRDADDCDSPRGERVHRGPRYSSAFDAPRSDKQHRGEERNRRGGESTRRGHHRERSRVPLDVVPERRRTRVVVLRAALWASCTKSHPQLTTHTTKVGRFSSLTIGQ